MSDRLAIDGGEPVRLGLLPYGRHCIEDDDVQAVIAALRSDWLTTGPRVEEFEAAFAARVGARHAVAVSSGTAALHTAVFAAGLGPGDEAVTTPLTFAATSNAVLYQGATPVFADIDERTLNLDPDRARASVTSCTKAILPVDYSGLPCAMREFSALARERGLIIIEDASHALGGTYQERSVGTLADMTVFSLHPVKLMTSGEGGIVTTDSAELARRMRIFRAHGITSSGRERSQQGAWFYEMVALGYNYRLTDIQCALGMTQLGKLDRFLARRREIAERLDAGLAGLPLRLPARLPDRESGWHLYVVRLRLDQLSVGRARVFAALRAENIGVNVHYVPVHLHPYYRDTLGHRPGECPVAERAYDELITLPLFPAMADADADDVIRAVHKVLGAYSK